MRLKSPIGLPKRDLLKQTQQFIVWLGVLPLILAFISYRTSSRQVLAVSGTLSTDECIRALDELLSTVQDAETGQRGYLLTGKPDYLQPFLQAKADVSAQQDRFHDLARRQGIPAAESAELRRLVNDKISELQKTVDLKASGKPEAALAVVDTGRGQRDMVSIRTLVRELKANQTGAFARQVAEQQRSQRQLNWILALGVTSGFFLLFLAYRFNQAYARERDSVEAQIRLLNQTLEVRVGERTAELQARTEELEARSEELQRSNGDLLQFAYVASHDLQEPLRMVGSYMGLLAKRYQGQLDETADRYIHFAIDGANRMQALIYDLLTYSRAGTQALEKKTVAFDAIIKVALQNLEVAIRESGAVVEHPAMPTVEADDLKLAQVLQNLISNAIKFRKPDVKPVVRLSVRHEARNWLFAVADNGIGFDPKYCDRIFQVFQRLHGVGKYPGNGIGLAICRRIVEHHGGQLWAESEPGVGSVFFFTLPRRETKEMQVLETTVARNPEAESAPHV